MTRTRNNEQARGQDRRARSAERPGKEEQPYLVGGGGVRAGGPQSREPLLQPVVRAVPQAVDGSGGQEDPHDGGHGDQREHRELRGVFLGCPMRQKLDFAFLQNRRGELVRS